MSEVPAPADVNEIPTGLSWHSFVEQAEAKVELDTQTQDVLEQAAEKARESIFKSDQSAPPIPPEDASFEEAPSEAADINAEAETAPSDPDETAG